MHSVDNAHGRAVRNNRRKRHFRFGERADVIDGIAGVDHNERFERDPTFST
jgi:hypothetical protein